MRITNVRVDSYSPRVAGVCSEITIVFDEVFAVHKVLVISGAGGLFVAMPTIAVDDGVGGNTTQRRRFKDIAHPLDRDFKLELDNAVLKAYNNYSK